MDPRKQYGSLIVCAILIALPEQAYSVVGKAVQRGRGCFAERCVNDPRGILGGAVLWTWDPWDSNQKLMVPAWLSRRSLENDGHSQTDTIML